MTPLRIAVPNKGLLAEPAATMLHEAGYRQRSDGRELVLLDADNNAELFFLRPASPGATCCRTPAHRPRNCCRWTSDIQPSGSLPERVRSLT